MNWTGTIESFMTSPIGDLRLTSVGEALTGITMELHKGAPASDARWRRDDDAAPSAREQLAAYFEGHLQHFRLPIVFEGTEFQRRVWEALRAIPFGETISYAELARRIGAPKAVRAVGAAVGRNPVSIVVPCHRVVGSDGSLTGFAGGIERKHWLLEHERANVAAGEPAGTCR